MGDLVNPQPTRFRLGKYAKACGKKLILKVA